MITIQKKIQSIQMQKIVKFYKEVKQEGLKITWPTKPEVITTTIMVFIFVILASIFFLLVDKIVSFLVELLSILGYLCKIGIFFKCTLEPKKKVEKELMAQLEKKGLKDNIEKIEIPSEEVVEMKKGKKINAERKFFPGYMLIKMIMDDEIWHTVRSIPKVYGFLGGKKVSLFQFPKSEVDLFLIK